ncbi:MAG: hypothetical protein ABEI86_11845, partial [Halobacteriaceae archaeon]
TKPFSFSDCGYDTSKLVIDDTVTLTKSTDKMKKKIIVRVAVIIIVLISLGNTVVAWQGSNLGEISSIDSTYIETEEQPVHIAPEASGTTVIVTNEWSSGFGPRSNAEIVAINPDGSLLYYNDSYLSYNDVDPVSNKSHTVMYIGHRVLDKPRCNQKCTREDIVLLNLTTGEQKVLWSRATPNVGNSRYHDADLINDTHLLVADIEYDRVFIVNITSGVITWQWQAQKDYNLSKGGP